MANLRLLENHKPVREYYASLRQYSLLHATHEGAVKAAFGTLLGQCAKQFEWTVLGEYELPRHKQRSLRVDGAIVDRWKLARGYWEAKDEHDDLALEAKKKIALGYPTNNILFQSPERAILYQNGKLVLDQSLAEPLTLVDILKEFFSYEPPAFAEWERAVEDFGDHVPKLANALLELIEKERGENKRFLAAFAKFLEVCRASINPNLSEVAVEKMLVQHLLTERIFRRVFDNPDFSRRNVIAIEIERVIDALVGRSFNRQKFLGELDRFYVAIEKTAATIDDYSEKQHFLNTIYERFFQSFDAKAADTHGIVYTPQSIVRFMVRSVDEILKEEFSSSLGARDVHVIDPFVGTGNFLAHVMRQIPKTQIESKYANELHANEVMLLPYYIASMNLEQAYAEITGEYRPFEGICLVDTFELAEAQQHHLAFMSEANSQRVEKQKRSPIFVVLGNPPYNAWQLDENDNNKNRKYAVLDQRVATTYAKDSGAKLKSSLSDPYVKAMRWASDRIGDEGIVAFVTNSGFLDGLACDGMRKHLARDFDAIYALDLGGNVRRNPKLSGTTHNVFGIQVGVSINLLVRRSRKGQAGRAASVYYARVDERWTRQEKYKYLEETGSIQSVQWKTVVPNASGNWLNDDERAEFAGFVPIAGKGETTTRTDGVIFGLCSNGLKSQRDATVYNFDREQLAANAAKFCRAYESELRRFNAAGRPDDIDAFVDPIKLKWSRNLKRELVRGKRLQFSEQNVQTCVYRPYTHSWLYFADIAIDEPGKLKRFFPKGHENRAIWLKTGAEAPMFALAVNGVPDLLPQGGSQCFPLFVYDADGVPRDNITDWSLREFRQNYGDSTLKKMDIFGYVYAMLQHPQYRERYAANLKRELPRIPYVEDFWAFARAGARLVELHLNYENQPEYPLRRVEMSGEKLDWRVAKMRITKDRQGVVYNNFLVLADLPREAFEYKLGSRSALEWVVDQYQVSTDARSGIANDPNRADDPQYIVRLLGQVVTVSVETMKIVNALPALDAEATPSEVAPIERRTMPPAKARPRIRPTVQAKDRAARETVKKQPKH